MKALIMYRLGVIHARLEREVQQESRSRFPDSSRLTRLKKLKLAIKDRLHQLTQLHAPQGA